MKRKLNLLQQNKHQKQNPNKLLRRSSLAPCTKTTLTTKTDFGSESLFGYGDSYECVETHRIKNLIASIVDRALIDVQLDSVPADIKRNALRWLKSPQTDPWSFKWCLEQLEYTQEAGKIMLQKALAKQYTYQSTTSKHD